MFGLSREEKLKKNFDKNGINTVGEITYIGDTAVDQFFPHSSVPNGRIDLLL